MVEYFSVYSLLKLVVLLTCFSLSYGYSASWCNSLSKVEIHHKEYFPIYLGYRFGTYSGIFYDIINQAVRMCCPTVAVEFKSIGETDQTVEEILVDTVKADSRGRKDGVLKLFFPEFADKTTYDVYDSTTPFIRLSKSPGHAIVMVKPDPIEPVFVGEIVVKSWAILVFLIAFAWFVGILAWMSDHQYNPIQFPNPFYVGMFEGFWWSVVTMTTVGYGDKTPKGPIARFLAVVWIIISTVFLALFTANATTILQISQAEEDHSITLGKKIGVLNSKHFVEVELNLGSTIVEYDSSLEWAMAATQDSEVDRLMFPNYIDFLFFIKDDSFKALFTRKFVLTNAIKSPFQIGMALAVENDNITTVEETFLNCMRLILPTLERQARKSLDSSSIEFTENTETKELKTALDGDKLLMLSYYFFGVIAVLTIGGLAWDYWIYRKERQSSLHDSIQGDAQAIEETQTEFDDVMEGSGSGNCFPNPPEDSTYVQY